ncbi:MAG: hypothetical protein H8E28_12505 [Anaerolineae bacterium]|nr:hypothetical protein [Anaerolineae bacterium]
MKGWLKAGLIGAGGLIVLNLLGIIPFVAFCVIPLRWITYIVVGVLAASYMLPPREAGTAAKEGALAATVAGAGGGVVNFIISLVQTATGGGAAAMAEVMRQIPPDMMRSLRDMGITPEMLMGAGGDAAAIGSAAVCGSVCCVGGIVFAAALGAVGAAIYASTKPN